MKISKMNKSELLIPSGQPAILRVVDKINDIIDYINSKDKKDIK